MGGQFAVYIGGGGLHFGRLLNQVANLLQEFLVSGHVGDGAGVGFVPCVHFQLNAVALGQQGGVFWGQCADDFVEAFPVGSLINAGAGQHFIVDEVVQGCGYLQAMHGGAFCHFRNLGLGS